MLQCPHGDYSGKKGKELYKFSLSFSHTFHFFLSAVGGRQEKKVKGKEKMERSKTPQNSGIAFCNELKKPPGMGNPLLMII